MVEEHHTDERENSQLTDGDDEKGSLNQASPDGEKGGPTDVPAGDNLRKGLPDELNRRSLLKLTGATAIAGLTGAVNAVTPARAARNVSSGDGYEVWKISGKEIYDLSDGEELSNILVDQTADGACLTIRSRNRSDWKVRNVGFLGVGEAGDGGNRFQLQVSTPENGQGLIENVWANGKARDGQPASELGGIYIRNSHAGNIDIRHTYIEGFGNNAVYGSAVGKDGGNDGTVTLENCYHRDNTVSQYRIGSPGSVVRNCVGVIDDPNGDRGRYPGNGTYNTRGVWGKHFRDQRVENSSFYVSEDDINWDGVFEARYIENRSHGDEAVAEIVDCDVNPDAPRLTGSTSNARVNITNLGENPTVTVIQDGGVPMSPEMAAKGEREMPPELPGASGGSSGGSSGSGDSSGTSSDLERTLTVDGNDADRTDYEFSVSDELEENPDLGSLGTGDSIDGSTATGFVNGGVDGYRFSGEVTDLTFDGNARLVIDGETVDPSAFEDAPPVISTDEASGVTDSTATLNGSLDSLGGADSVDVGFEWRSTDADTWNRTPLTTRTDTGAYSVDLTGLSTDTTYQFRAIAEGSDDDSATGSLTELTTGSTTGNRRTLTVDGTGADWTDYEITVSGALKENPDVGSLGTGDSIDGNTATGFVNGGIDGYLFTGDITGITVEGDASIIVDGEEIDPDQLVLPNRISFEAADNQSNTTYEFEVSDELENAQESGSLEDADRIEGLTATGTVSDGDTDSFRFSGDLLSLRVDGEASIIFEDNDG